MKKILLAALLASPAAAAPVPAPSAGAPSSGVPYWFKFYSTAPYKEFWTGELFVKDLVRDLPKVIAGIEKNGGVLTQPVSTFAASKSERTQQLSFTVPGRTSKALLKSLRGIGDMDKPLVRPSGMPIPLDEVKSKIGVLMNEKKDHADALAKVPAAAAAEEEILEHLLLVEEVAERADTEVRVNLLVKQR